MPAKRGPKPRKPKAPGTAHITAPADLSLDELREFNRLVDEVKSKGLLGQSDVRLIEAAARTQVILDRAHRELSKGDLTQTAANGTSMPHPMLGVINSQTMRLRGLLADLGLTPKSAKYAIPPKAEDPEDGWGDLLSITG